MSDAIAAERLQYYSVEVGSPELLVPRLRFKLRTNYIIPRRRPPNTPKNGCLAEVTRCRVTLPRHNFARILLKFFNLSLHRDGSPRRLPPHRPA